MISTIVKLRRHGLTSKPRATEASHDVTPVRHVLVEPNEGLIRREGREALARLRDEAQSSAPRQASVSGFRKTHPNKAHPNRRPAPDAEDR